MCSHFFINSYMLRKNSLWLCWNAWFGSRRELLVYVVSSCLTKPSPTSDLSLLGVGRLEGGGPEEEEQRGSTHLGLCHPRSGVLLPGVRRQRGFDRNKVSGRWFSIHITLTLGHYFDWSHYFQFHTKLFPTKLFPTAFFADSLSSNLQMLTGLKAQSFILFIHIYSFGYIIQSYNFKFYPYTDSVQDILLKFQIHYIHQLLDYIQMANYYSIRLNHQPVSADSIPLLDLWDHSHRICFWRQWSW